MKTQAKRTVITLANAIELATGVVHEIVGDNVAKTLGGAKATRQQLADYVGSRIQARLSKHTSRKA